MSAPVAVRATAQGAQATSQLAPARRRKQRCACGATRARRHEPREACAAAAKRANALSRAPERRIGLDFSRFRLHASAAPPRYEALEREADHFADAGPRFGGRATALGAAYALPVAANPLMHAAATAGLQTFGEPVPASALAGLAPALRHSAQTALLHRDPVANAMARLLGAYGYASGSHVVLGPQASDLNSRIGRRTLAHELVHVAQQAGSAGAGVRPQFSLQTYIQAMNQKPEPNWSLAAEHLNGESPDSIKALLKNLSPHYRVKLHEAARVWPGLCSNVGRLTEADYLAEHPDTTDRVATACRETPQAAPAPTPPPQPEPPGAPSAGARELTEGDAKTCSPLYLQKLCVYIIGGFNGDRSGVETPEEMAGYNKTCRTESLYDGPDIQLSDAEKSALRSPQCERGDPEKARARARAARLSDVLDRCLKYIPGGAGEEVVAMIKNPIFLGSLGVAVGAYLLLWLVPEPVFTKIAAAATTIALLSTGLFTISTIVNLASAWGDLQTDIDAAQSDLLLEQAAERFGKRIGAIGIDLLVFIASLVIGGKLPVPKRFPPAGAAITDAERALASAEPGGKLIEGPWGSARIVPRVGGGIRGNNALELYPNPEPGKLIPLPQPKPQPAPAPVAPPAAAKGVARGTGPQPTIVPPVVPGVGTQPGTSTPQRPPFKLLLPRQKAPHLAHYRGWLGVLESDPNYQRGNPGQLEKWHQALRIGGSNAIPAAVYQRGHRLGFTGEVGERRVRVPDWSRTASKPMEVDHVIELQVTPASMRNEFNSIDNYELLDRAANGSSGPLLAANVAAERAKQVAFDPSAAGRIVKFDAVELDGGSEGERWSVDDIRSGRQLDAFEASLGH
jgi:uncharacterized protein DUF4157